MKSTLKVLFIEDNPSDADLAVRHLTKSGYSIKLERVETSETLIEAIEKKQWDIVFSDYQLPSLNAPEAFKIFKSFNLNIPFILISGAIGEEAAVKMIKAGVNDYVMKSNLAQLPVVVKHELEEAEARKEALEESQAQKTVTVGELSGNYFKTNLEFLLEDKGIKQSQLARDTGISKQTISDWLNKDSLINIQQAFKLTRYFKITVENLFMTNLKSVNLENSDEVTFVNMIPTPFHVLSYDLTKMHANKGFCDLLGFSEYEMNSRIYSDLIHSDDVANMSVSFKKLISTNIITFTHNLRMITTKGTFRWINNIFINSPSEEKLYVFSSPIDVQPNDKLLIENIQLEKIATREFEKIEATTIWKKLTFVNEIDPKLLVQTDRDILRCLLRSLYHQLQAIEFESKDKFEVLIRTRVEDDRAILSTTVNCKIHPTILDISRVKKVASIVGIEISENYAGNLYSFYIAFPKR
jgi:CheY-like chemotaxis protein